MESRLYHFCEKYAKSKSAHRDPIEPSVTSDTKIAKCVNRVHHFGALTFLIHCWVGKGDHDYHDAHAQTNVSSSRALIHAASSHERGKDKDARAARAHRSSDNQRNYAQDERMHAPETPGSARPQGGRNALFRRRI